jgi:tetratricopeptide (TPR) repeat protein
MRTEVNRMEQAVSERMQKLQKMLEKEPNDTFLIYGIAMEHKKANQFPEALGFFQRVIELDPGYCYAYHQQGLIHEAAGDVEAARKAYRDGIAAAQRKGDAHAQGEIEAALAMIE